jgi:hypothetical protein
MEQLGEMKYLGERIWGTELILIIQCKKERQKFKVLKAAVLKLLKG